MTLSCNTSEPDSMESHHSDNYITVIPVEYPRSRVYAQPTEYLVEQYSDYIRDRTREEYMRGDYNINSEPGFDEVYTLSQRFERDKAHSSYGGHDIEWGLHSHVSSSSEIPPQSKEGSTSGVESQSDDHPAAAQQVKMCVYLMSRVVLRMDLDDGVNTTVQDLVQTILQEEDLGLPRAAANIFTLWISSGLLELQLKPHHKPYEISRSWTKLLTLYGNGTQSRMEKDEPILSYQRNVFFSKRDEEKIKEQQRKFLPAHVSHSNWSWLRISSKNSPEVRLLEQFKRIPSSTPVRKLVRKYLEFCWSLPYYGGAFFQGQIEQPVRGLTSLITHQDVPVLVAINAHGVYIIDDIQCTLLLGLKYEEMSWDFAKPSQEDNLECLPCIFIQFMVLENGARVSKILQVFSKQAVMMDTLITVFVEDLKQKTTTYTDETERPMYDTSTDSDDTHVPLTMVNRREIPQACLSNKLSKLTLATFDEDGRCIGQMGSWAFSY